MHPRTKQHQQHEDTAVLQPWATVLPKGGRRTQQSLPGAPKRRALKFLFEGLYCKHPQVAQQQGSYRNNGHPVRGNTGEKSEQRFALALIKYKMLFTTV